MKKPTFRGRVLSQAELDQIRREVEGFDSINVIDEEMRADRHPVARSGREAAAAQTELTAKAMRVLGAIAFLVLGTGSDARVS